MRFMNQNNMKKLLFIILFMALYSQPMENGLQWGNLTLFNTLDEDVNYIMCTTLNGTDDCTNYTFNNQERTYSNTIPPGQRKLLSAGINIGGSNLYGSIIKLYLQKKSQKKQYWYCINFTKPVENTTIDLKQLIQDIEENSKHKIL